MISSVAIRKPDGKIYSLPAPGRHADVIRHRLMVEEGWEFGFLGDDGQFLTREEVAAEAVKAGQVAEGTKRLFSELIW